MKIKEGDKIPNSEFYYLDETGAPKKISSSELFDNCLLYTSPSPRD